MTNRSERNLTEILDRYARLVMQDAMPDNGAAYDSMTKIEQHRLKDGLLPGLMQLLNLVDEVDGHEGWERIFEVHASLDPEQRGAVYLLVYPDGTKVALGDAEDNYAELAGIIDDEYEKGQS